jgi:hypothetical protein
MLRRGDYVLCNFPFREAAGPGPSPHVVLCAATGRETDIAFAIVFYTTSQTDYHGQRRPRQYIFVNETRAVGLGQRSAFHIDASRIARLPLTTDYFPELVGSTIPVRGRDPAVVARVEERLRDLIATGFEVIKVDAVMRSSK